MLGANAGLSQKELSDLFGVFPSRLVLLLDQLESRGFIARHADPLDRRGHRVHLTDAGRKALAGIGRVTHELENTMCSSLSDAERETLTNLLMRVVSQQNITPAVHPAYRKLQERRGRASAEQVRLPSRKQKRA